MKRFGLLLPLLVSCAVLPSLASAGVFSFTKKVKGDPAQRVQQLLAIVKTDGDESKRVDALEELREFDAGQFPEMIPVLCDVLLSDSKASVRAEAAQVLGKVRPVNQQAGNALEQAVAKDAYMRVRLSARTALVGYYMAGFKGGKKEEGPILTNKEPPLADPNGKPPAPVVKTPTPNRFNPVQPTRVVPNETGPPPLADPEPAPSRPTTPTLVPTAPPVLQPAPVGPNEGPLLVPPG